MSALSLYHSYARTHLWIPTAPLSLKLAEEIKYETENSDQSEPEFLTEFKSEGVWKVRLNHQLTSQRTSPADTASCYSRKIKDEPGSDEITLTRSFGNEK